MVVAGSRPQPIRISSTKPALRRPTAAGVFATPPSHSTPPRSTSRSVHRTCLGTASPTILVCGPPVSRNYLNPRARHPACRSSGPQTRPRPAPGCGPSPTVCSPQGPPARPPLIARAFPRRPRIANRESGPPATRCCRAKRATRARPPSVNPFPTTFPRTLPATTAPLPTAWSAGPWISRPRRTPAYACWPMESGVTAVKSAPPIPAPPMPVTCARQEPGPMTCRWGPIAVPIRIVRARTARPEHASPSCNTHHTCTSA